VKAEIASENISPFSAFFLISSISYSSSSYPNAKLIISAAIYSIVSEKIKNNFFLNYKS
jgi:hypothetical protein